jgi:putative tryptophan/tyrosine transport system substrate-binding protein
MNKKIFFAAMIIFTLGALGIVNAQPTGKMPRIGILADFITPQLDALRQGLRDLGYIEGQNLFIEYRYVEGRHERIPELVG